MNVYIWSIFLIGGFFLFYLALKYKGEYPAEGHVMLIIAGFFILMSGLFVFAYGIDVPIGEHIRNYPACSLCGNNWTAIYENVTDPNTNRTVSVFKGYEPSIGSINSTYGNTYIASTDKTKIYLTLKGGLRSYGLSYALMFFSLVIFGLAVFSYLDYKKNKVKGTSYSEESDD